MLDPGDVFFFEQTRKWQPTRRYRKLPDELPQSMRFAHLNKSVQAFLQNKEKEDSSGNANDGSSEVKVKESLLPDISYAFSMLKGKLDEENAFGSSHGGGGDMQRAFFLETKTSAAALLELLARLLGLLQQAGKRPSLPRSLEHQLQCCYEELCENAVLVRREWQLPANEAAHKAEEKAKAEMAKGDAPDKSALRADDDSSSVRRAPHVSRDELDSDGEVKDGKLTSASTRALPEVGLGARSAKTQLIAGGEERGSRSSRVHSRKSQSENKKPGMAATSARRSNLPAATEARLAVTMGHRSEDALSSAGTPGSAKSSNAPQPYSLTVLQFNLSNIKAMEEKGCKVFVTEDDLDNRAASLNDPLQWAVKRLSSAARVIRAESLLEKAKGARSVPFVRCYGDKLVSEKQMQKSFVERLGIYSSLIRGEAIKVPSLPTLSKSNSQQRQQQQQRPVMQTQTCDGSQCLFYDTGRLAVITSGSSDTGFYTIAYDEEADPPKMVACFSPQGRGCCYYPNGKFRYLSSDSDGKIFNEDGSFETFHWLANGKLAMPVNFLINKNISVRIQGHDQSFLVFVAQGFAVKVAVGKDEKATDAITDVPVLQTQEGEYEFESDFAIELLNQQRTLRGQMEKKQDRKLVFKLKAAPSASRKLDIKSTADSDAEYAKLEKDLERLKTKTKLLIDDWMETYRIATGMTSPHINRLRDSNTAWKNSTSLLRTAMSHSAKSTPGSYLPEAAIVDEDTTTPIPIVSEEERRRVPSAPCNMSMWNLKAEEDGKKGQSVQFDSLVKFSNISDGHVGATSAPQLRQAPRHLPRSPRENTMATVASLHAPWAVPPRGQCPVALRQEILGRGIAPCRCQQRKIPHITDVEFDEFVQKCAPPKQLIVISVTSSLLPEERSSSGREMLDKTHSDRNAHRAMPCLQARADSFRIFHYDLSTARHDTDRSQALLAERHGAAPGMFLIYESGRLLFCDHVFNGYSSSVRTDFQKQLNECRRLAVAGASLPADFKFNSARSQRRGLATAGSHTRLVRQSGGRLSATADKFLLPLGTVTESSAAAAASIEYNMGQGDKISSKHTQKDAFRSTGGSFSGLKVNQNAPPLLRQFKGHTVHAHSAR